MPRVTSVLSTAFPPASAAPRDAYVADRRLYLDAAGTVVEADDPARRTLLLAPGGTMPRAQAMGYGLVTDADAMAAASAPDGEDMAETKAKASARATSSGAQKK